MRTGALSSACRFPLPAPPLPLRVLRAETTQRTSSSARIFTLTLTWTAAEPLPAPVQVYAQAWKGETPLAQADGPLGTELFPSQWWPRGAVVRERREFVLQLGDSSEPPPQFLVALYDPLTLARVPRADPAAEAGQYTVVISP